MCGYVCRTMMDLFPLLGRSVFCVSYLMSFLSLHSPSLLLTTGIAVLFLNELLPLRISPQVRRR
ncbi:hypothetical protein CSUI_006256 [Cystoisospora suis]|uniref:Uncharacterized protein n=1 Tax=Cystoisospora suis TaxID=483139 RepID=A0A2C6KV10_9APIC|nr:hypothetical protein CSUI_006256 [Cystoisospora suis]